MKKLFFLKTSLLICITSIFIFSCKSKLEINTNTPEYVVEKFLYHLNRAEFVEAKQYGTQSTKTILDFIISLTAMVEQGEENKLADPIEVVIEKCVVQDNIAICYYIANEKKEQIELVKENNIWLVNLKKESFNNQQ